MSYTNFMVLNITAKAQNDATAKVMECVVL